MCAALAFPADEAVSKSENRVLRDVEDVGIAAVDGIALRLALDQAAEQLHRVLEGGFLQADGAAGVKILAQDVGGKGDGAAGVLFFAEAEEIGGVADLRLHFLFAIAVIIVGDDRDHHAALIAAADFERDRRRYRVRPDRASTCRRAAGARWPRFRTAGPELPSSCRPDAARESRSRCGRSNARRRARRHFPADTDRRHCRKSTRRNPDC